MKKSILVLPLLLSLLLPSLAFADVAPEPDVFTDVQDGDEGYYAISWMKDEGIVSGYDDGSYRPDNNINRAEFSKIISLATDISMAPETDSSDFFTDVEGDDWFFTYVIGLYQRSVISGYSDQTFRPGNDINYAEACKMIALAYGLEVSETSGEWYEPYVKWVSDMGGMPDSIESNGQTITRVEMAIMIYGVRNNL